jgi:hypothetical protein
MQNKAFAAERKKPRPLKSDVRPACGVDKSGELTKLLA